MSDRMEHWTVEVCEQCGKVHRNRRRRSCVVEYDPAGDSFAATRTVEVVPRSRLEGAMDRASEMYEEFLAERRMLREALIEHGETDEQLAARYAALKRKAA